MKDRRPDICVYEEGTDESHYTKGEKKKAFANLGYAHMFIEVKGHDREDYFDDPVKNSHPTDRPSHSFIRRFDAKTPSSELAREDLGQIVAYATEALAKQHRVAYYSVSVRGIKARLMRWDRSGAIATEEFDLHKNSRFLCEFLWRYSKGTAYERGFDDTVTRASVADEQVFVRVIRDHVRLQGGHTEETEKFRKAVDMHYVPGQVYIVRVFSAGQEDYPHEYLVSRPVVSPRSLTAPATRGYWAVARDSKTIAFLKDVWRYEDDFPCQEGDILQKLENAKVASIPRLSCHGYVLVLEEASPKSLCFSFSLLSTF